MALPDHLSVSQIRKHLGCPLAYRFAYVDHIETGTRASALVFGKAVHVAAELLHRHLMDGGAQEDKVYHDALRESLAAQFKEFDVRVKEGESLQTLTDEGARLFDLYLQRRTCDGDRIVAAEKRIECDLVNIRTHEALSVPFVGYLDLVERDSDGRSVVADVKTTRKSHNQSTVDADVQLSAYALLLLLSEGAEPARLRIDALVRNKTPKLQTVETRRTERDLVRFWSLARAVWCAIQAGNSYPNPSWLCPGCEYAQHCGQWGQ